MATPFDEESEECMGCSACAETCPTGAIPVKEEDGQREIWHKFFEMSRCEECGKYYSTQLVSEHIKEQTELLGSCENLCPSCRRKKLAAEIAKVRLHVD